MLFFDISVFFRFLRRVKRRSKYLFSAAAIFSQSADEIYLLYPSSPRSLLRENALNLGKTKHNPAYFILHNSGKCLPAFFTHVLCT